MAKSNDLGGVWRTINGNHVFIKDGQTVAEALEEDKKKKAKLKETENKAKEEKKQKEKDIIKDKPDDLIDDDEKKYYNPNTGEGPFTEQEAGESLEREFDYIKPEEYSPYLKETLVDNYAEDFMKKNGIDINDREEFQRIKDDIYENPEHYLEWEDVSEAKEHYLEDHGTKESDWMGKGEEIPGPKSVGSKEPVMQYESGFHLESSVNDFDAAQAYLSDDDMTQYLPEELKGKISSAEWVLDDDESGRVVIKATEELTPDETKALQDWIDGQNSDGLGEGFEQQEFATSYWNPETGEGPFTYREFEQEQERMYDELEPYEYADYLDDYAVEAAAQDYMTAGGFDLNDEDALIAAREEIREYPEDYLDWEDIAHAKDEYFKEHGGSNEDEWYAMSSMRRDQDDFTTTPIEKSVDISSMSDTQLENEFNNLKEGDNSQYADAVRNAYQTSNEFKASEGRTTGTDRYTQLKEKFNRGEIEPYSAEDYELRDLKYQKAIDDGILTQEEVDYLKTKEDWQMDKATRADVDNAKHYMENAENTKKSKEKFLDNVEKEWVENGSLKDVYERNKVEAQKLGMTEQEFKDELFSINQAETWGEDWYNEKDPTWGNKNFDSDEKASDMLLNEARNKHQNIYMETEADAQSGYKHYNDDIIRAHDNFEKYKKYETFTDDEWNNASKEQQQKLAKDSLVNFFKDNKMDEEEMLDFQDELRNNNFHTESEQIIDAYKEANGSEGSTQKTKTMNEIMNDKIRNGSKKKVKEEGYSHPIAEDYEERKTMYNTINNDANNRYKKKEISLEERNKIIDDAHDKYIKEKENVKISISDALIEKAYQKYLKEHPGSKMSFDDFKKRNK